MSNKDIFSKVSYQPISDTAMYQMYLEIKFGDPKSEDISTSLYLTCVAIQILEKLGNKFPTQQEIDYVEAYLKRFNRRKIFLKKVA